MLSLLYATCLKLLVFVIINEQCVYCAVPTEYLNATQINIQVLRFSPVFIIPPMLHTNRHLHVLTTTTNGRILWTSFGNRGALDRTVLPHFFAFKEYNTCFVCIYHFYSPGSLTLRPRSTEG